MDPHTQKWRNIFDELDVNKDGKLSFDELQFASDGVRSAFTGEDELTFEEFLNVMTGLGMTGGVQQSQSSITIDSKSIRTAVWNQYSAIFKMLDAKGVGQVDSDTIANRLRLAPSKARQMVEDADQDGDGMMDFPEFVHFMSTKDPRARVGATKTDDDEDFSEGELLRYQMLFGLLDVDNQGKVSPTALKSSLHLDEQLFQLLQSCCDVSSDGSISFPALCEALHEYEKLRDLEASRNRASIIDVIHKSQIGESLEGHAREYFDYLRDDAEDVSSLRVINFLETVMHSGHARTSAADYQLQASLQNSINAVGEERLNFSQFVSLVNLYPGNVFLKYSRVESIASRGGFKTPATPLKRNSIAAATRLDLDSNSEDDQLIQSIFDYLDTEKTGKIDKNMVNAGFVRLAASSDDHGLVFETLFTLLEAIDTYPTKFIDVHELKAILVNYGVPLEAFSAVSA